LTSDVPCRRLAAPRRPAVFGTLHTLIAAHLRSSIAADLQVERPPLLRAAIDPGLE
jgi:hypothetical protein